MDIVKLLGQLLEEFYPSFVEKNLSYELQSNVPCKDHYCRRKSAGPSV
ncbi:MAG: hypothetical protein ACLTBV_10760 [Enterocloster bolteae]